MRRTSKRARGFTLVELLTVIAILGFVAGAAAMSLRSNRGDKVASFSRTLLAQVNDARHNALTTKQPTRLVVSQPAGSSSYRLSMDAWDPTAQVFKPLGRVLTAPADVVLCSPASFVALGVGFNPACPSPTFAICFLPTWGAYLQTGTTCPPVVATPTGATIFVNTVQNDKHYKVAIFGLTGMPRMTDQW